MITMIDNKNFDGKNIVYNSTKTMREYTRDFILNLMKSERKEHRIISKKNIRKWGLCDGIKEVIVRNTRFYIEGVGSWFDIVHDIHGNVFVQAKDSDAKFTQMDIADDKNYDVNIFLDSLCGDVKQMINMIHRPDDDDDDEDDDCVYSIYPSITNTKFQLLHMGTANIGGIRSKFTEECVQKYVAEARRQMFLSTPQHTQA